MKISKVANRDKLQLKKEGFIAWEQAWVLRAYFKQIEKVKKQVAKWNITVSDDESSFMLLIGCMNLIGSQKKQ